MKDAARRAIRTALRENRGSALIETALSAPLLLTMVMAIAQFGVAYNNNIVLAEATRAGARQLSVGRGAVSACAPAYTKAQNAATNLKTASLTLKVSYKNNTSGTTTNYTSPTDCSAATWSTVDDVTMTLTYPCSVVVLGVNFAPSCTLTSAMTARVE
jgi:Flp pilus assembly protein TadG